VVIPVCWETPGFAVEKDWVRNIVEATYERQPYFHVDFTGWSACGPSSSGIRIVVRDTPADAAPRIAALGRALDGVTDGVAQNFTFSKWRPACAASEATRRDCIEDIAVHGFGHALGLAHGTQGVAGDPAAVATDCADAPSGGDVAGPADTAGPSSIMAFCDPAWNNDGFLGQSDVAALARLYGDGGDVFVASSTGGGFGPPRARHDRFCTGDDVCLTGDFNGDGRQDLVAFTRGASADVIVALSTGDGFNGSGWKWHDDFAAGRARPAIGDVDGDGKDDIIAFSGGDAGDVTVALSTGTSFRGGNWKWHDAFAGGDAQTAVGDVNGDGKADLVAMGAAPNAQVTVALSIGDSFVGTDWVWLDRLPTAEAVRIGVGDFDGDGKADLAGFTAGPHGEVLVALSTGDRFVPRAAALAVPFAFDAGSDGPPAIGDLNGDGKDDLVVFERGDAGRVVAAISTGTSFDSSGGPGPAGLCTGREACVVADVTGDGRVDAVTFHR
jgi:hypothetical protein